jgi:hypothetical protein
VSVTSPGLRVQSVVMPFGDPQSWTLVDQDSAVVEPVEGFHVTSARDRALTEHGEGLRP